MKSPLWVLNINDPLLLKNELKITINNTCKYYLIYSLDSIFYWVIFPLIFIIDFELKIAYNTGMNL